MVAYASLSTSDVPFPYLLQVSHFEMSGGAKASLEGINLHDDPEMTAAASSTMAAHPSADQIQARGSELLHPGRTDTELKRTTSTAIRNWLKRKKQAPEFNPEEFKGRMGERLERLGDEYCVSVLAGFTEKVCIYLDLLSHAPCS